MKAIESLLLSIGLLILRVGAGGMMLTHGWTKLSGYSQLADVFPDPIGLGSRLSLISAIGAEFGCAVLLMLGIFTRVVAAPLAFTMFVAVFIVHANHPFIVPAGEAANGKELAALYLVIFISLMLTGGGAFSLDRFVWRLRKKS